MRPLSIIGLILIVLGVVAVVQGSEPQTLVPDATSLHPVEIAGQHNDFTIMVAVIGLVGALIGAAIGAVSTYYVAVRREQGENDREAQKHTIEVKRAARLIDAELLAAQAAVAIAIEERHWWNPDAPLSSEAWQKYSSILAPDLSDQAWLEVRIGAQAATDVRGARADAVENGIVANRIADSTAETLSPMLEDIRCGRRALKPFVWDVLPGPDSPASQTPSGT